ncbi:MAG: hypothetical protein GQ574_08250 [Crocinitomix sp.]|nr:hypothetical protein [Crocinitomix sp.]
MIKVKNILQLILILCLTSSAFGQKGVTTFGIQYKPIIPNTFIGSFEQDFNQNQLTSTVKQKVGHAFSFVVRQGLTKNISFETGLGFTQRNFNLDFAVEDSNYFKQGEVGFIGYEIPVKALVFIRLGESLFMNTALGASFNYFPSDVKVDIPITVGEYFSQEGAYRQKIQGALLADIGFEFRTRKSGYFYLGSSYNLPFTPIVTFAMAYEYQGGDQVAIENIRGSYLTIDFRYYFHEKPRSEQRN